MNKKVILLVFFLITTLLIISCQSKTAFFCPQGQILHDKSCIQKTICGNRICENTENPKLCAIDCPRLCESQFCNNQIQIVCAQNDCSSQEQLFSSFLTLQTGVASCLSQYFSYTPPRITYEIEVKQSSNCAQEGGCCCTEGGQTSVQSIHLNNLNGFISKDQSVPMKEEHLLADEHETTHFILNHMLGPHPSWFSEAIAIQTNERAGCDTKVLVKANPKVLEYSKDGDAYLLETPADTRGYGVRLNDGSYLNTKYYYQLKEGTSQLLNGNQYEPHIIGTFWIIGLKEEYRCTEICIKKILQELRTKVRDECTLQKNCEGQIVSNKMIYDATKKVLGKDPDTLFKMLEIEKYKESEK